MQITGQSIIAAMGDSNNMPEKQGWVFLLEVVGEYNDGRQITAPAGPPLTYWKTTRNGHPTAIAQMLSKASKGDMLEDAIIRYSRSVDEEAGTDFQNFTLVGANKVIHQGQGVADDDSVLPRTDDKVDAGTTAK